MFTLFVMAVAGGGVSQGTVVLPTLELCEATRSAVIELPPIADGTAVCGLCAPQADEAERPPLVPFGGGVS